MAKASANRPSGDDLRRMYESERLTAQAIADRCSVRKITVLRWLEAEGVRRRPPGNGLAARGVPLPSRDLLRDLVWGQHLSYDEIAQRYGVDRTAVPQWLEAHAIPRPSVWETRRRGRVVVESDAADLRARVDAGESLASIARSLGVSRTTVRAWCEKHRVEVRPDGWHGGRRLACLDGHDARSTYEQRVDDWLYRNGIEHYVEPAYPWDQRYRADFRIGSTFVEVWGVTNNDAYRQRKAMKIARCAAEGIQLIGIEPHQFHRGTWTRRLRQFANPA
ncbi:MAG: hypothetical protein HOW59_37000 [Nonomuraea sp.]|nr:hypothetical protein [Nonomuraea sp.]NUQ31329.1 hypothetical protein [Dermatophilaceae bacterium]NUR81045.1 hypothetical protein [Dermatophilaceae bacterium]